MKKKRNLLDERQEQELLKIERRGFYLTFAGLVGLEIIFSAMSDFPGMMGTLALVLLVAIYVVAAEIRAGIWSRKLRADWKTNLLVSVAGGFGCFLVLTLIAAFVTGAENPAASLMLSASFGVGTGLLCFLILQLCAWACRHRVQELEEEEEEREAASGEEQ